MKKLAILFFVFLIFASFASAQEACCEKNNDGLWCQYASIETCDEGYQSTYALCSQTSFCQTGTCVSSDTGKCYPNTPRATCEVEGYTWHEGDLDTVDQCQSGCCAIGDQAFFVTEVQCKSVATEYGVSFEYDDTIESEVACIDSVRSQELGCCVSEEGYVYTTRDACDTAGMEVTATEGGEQGFYTGLLCSNDLLSSGCAKQTSTECYDGKVYWYDSCGNRENVWSTDETISYNNGYFLEPDNICIADRNDPDCGNCDYTTGALCSEDLENVADDSDYYCRDVNCYDTYDDENSFSSGDDKKNGESWCIYDSLPGAGRDLVGSRHYRHLCINGEEIVDSCQDFREEICIQGTLTSGILETFEAMNLDSGSDYVEARCRDNRWEECTACNDLVESYEIESGSQAGETVSYYKTAYTCCINDAFRDCFWVQEDVDTDDPDYYDYGFGGAYELSEWFSEVDATSIPAGLCVPNVPPGLEFWGESGDSEADSSATSQCATASTTCYAKWQIGGFEKIFTPNNPDAWELIDEDPAGCMSRSWLVDQNTMCKMMGDCGAYYNIVGDVSTEGFTSSMFGDQNQLFEFNELTQEDLDDWDILLSKPSPSEDNPLGQQILKDPWTWVAGGAILGGGAISGFDCASQAEDKKGSAFGSCFMNTFGPASLISVGQGVFGLLQGNLGGVGGLAGAGGALGGGKKEVEAPTGEGTGKTISGIGWIVALSLVVKYGLADTLDATFDVECLPWVPPQTKDNCELCNEDMKPCSEYKCHSLGATCDLVNEGTSDEECVSLHPNDVNSPIITPLDELFVDVTYTVTTEEGVEGFEVNEPLPAFQTIEVGIQTDEPAQCKFSEIPATEYESMTRYFGDSLYLYDHKATLSLPGELAEEEYVELTGGTHTLYIRCQDANGNSNAKDYFIRFNIDTSPDLTPPEVEFTSLGSERYVAEGVNELEYTLYMSEPSECRWAKNNIDYDLMVNQMSCSSSSYSSSSIYFGTFLCSGILTNVSDLATNTFYFRCKDHPGSSVEDSNVNSDSFEFVTKATEALVIEEFGPTSTQYSSTVELTIETDNGAENGKAICGYTDLEDASITEMLQFLETNSTKHTQELQLTLGTYTYYIGCYDIAGNVVYNETTFEVEVDESVPSIIEIYADIIFQILHLEFNEKATCEYDEDDFTYGEGALMGTNSTEHEASLQENYVIKCQDQYGNEGTYRVYL